MFIRENTQYFACNEKCAFFTSDVYNNHNLRSCQKVCDALVYLSDNIFIRFGTKLYRQTIGIPMGTNCAPLVITEFLRISVLRVASGPRVKLASCKSALNPTVVCSTDRSKAVVPVLVLLFVALWFILRGDLLYVFPCFILFLCFSVLLVLRLPRLGKRELILVLFVRLFGLCLFRFVGFLFLLGSGKGCGLWLWHSWTFLLPFLDICNFVQSKRRLFWGPWRTANHCKIWTKKPCSENLTLCQWSVANLSILYKLASDMMWDQPWWTSTQQRCTSLSSAIA